MADVLAAREAITAAALAFEEVQGVAQHFADLAVLAGACGGGGRGWRGSQSREHAAVQVRGYNTAARLAGDAARAMIAKAKAASKAT
jgi:hypothetical protein